MSSRIAILAALLVASSTSSPLFADDLPTSVTVGQYVAAPNNQGDTWAPAWTKDNRVFSPSNDGSGFGSSPGTNIHFNEITGDTPTALNGVTTNPMLEYGAGSEEKFARDYAADQSYGPVNFRYTVAGAATHDAGATTVKHLGSLRNDYSDYVGCKFTTGSSPLIVKSLGRLVAPGNTRNHPVEIVDAESNVMVASATVNTAGQPAGKFAYASLSAPVTLAANHAYYLLSLEVQGGDFWYDDDTTLKTSRDLAINIPEYHKSDGYSIDGRAWKSSGCLAVDGALYLVVGRHHYSTKQSARDASIIKSPDEGKTWTRSEQENYDHPMFPGSRFATPYFIPYGQDGKEVVADQSDKYVYALSNNGFWDNGDNLILGRVLRSRIGDLNGKDWQYYKGGNGAESSSWGSDPNKAALVLDKPDKVGETGAVYLPKWKCYLMVNWYYPAGSGRVTADASHTTRWDFYVAKHPWGPWKMIAGSHTFHPEAFYCVQVCPKFTSADGNTVWAFTAGDFQNGPQGLYRLVGVPLTLK